MIVPILGPSVFFHLLVLLVSVLVGWFFPKKASVPLPIPTMLQHQSVVCVIIIVMMPLSIAIIATSVLKLILVEEHSAAHYLKAYFEAEAATESSFIPAAPYRPATEE